MVEPQTSAIQERPDGTYQELQETDSDESETVQNEQNAVAETDPFAVVFKTLEYCPLVSVGTVYPDTIAVSHPGAAPVFAPSTRAQVDEGLVRSLTSQTTEP